MVIRNTRFVQDTNHRNNKLLSDINSTTVRVNNLEHKLIPWRVDETYIKIGGKWCYLYRAIDSEGATIDFWISINRDKKSAKKFFNKALKPIIATFQE